MSLVGARAADQPHVSPRLEYPTDPQIGELTGVAKKRAQTYLFRPVLFPGSDQAGASMGTAPKATQNLSGQRRVIFWRVASQGPS